jgi:hypothetical protein
MREVTIVSVTDDRQLEIPPEVQAQLNPGDEYMIWATDDAITFKKIQKPLRFDELQKRIDPTFRPLKCHIKNKAAYFQR